MLLPGREWQEGYRFGFGGKEIFSQSIGNEHIDFGARIYQHRIGRWLSRDPMERNYSSWSSYNAFLNNPIALIDEQGKGAKVSIETLSDGRTVILVSAQIYIYSNVSSIQSDLNNWATSIQTDVNNQLNAAGAFDYITQKGLEPNRFPIVFDIKVNAVEGAGSPKEAQEKMNELLAKAELNSDVNFILLNDDTPTGTVGGVTARSVSNVGTWPVSSSRSIYHWSHEFLHLLNWRIPTIEPGPGGYGYDTHAPVGTESAMEIAGDLSAPTELDIQRTNFNACPGAKPDCACPNTIKEDFKQVWSNGNSHDNYRYIWTKYIGQVNTNVIFPDAVTAVDNIDTMPVDMEPIPKSE